MEVRRRMTVVVAGAMLVVAAPVGLDDGRTAGQNGGP